MNVKENDMSNQNNNVKINLSKNTLEKYEENINDKSNTLKNSNVIIKCNQYMLNNNLVSNTIDNIFNLYLIKNSIDNTIESYQKFINDKSISNKLTNKFNIINNVIQNNLSLYVINNDKNIRLYRR